MVSKKVKGLSIKIVDGQWYAVLEGKHLTAQETAAQIARGTPYQIVK
ncbi:hypothetical protein LCGC14_0387430 [marine sediment metagenome]|uniref:Uncharacterized protein n=1 Tax=marine sediment metagenome TaxID=412755 RepID=A0A0F9VMI3_9ZZZZ